MSYHHQWLYLQDESGAYEVFNGARTASYLANPDLTAPGALRVSNVLDMGGCDAYAYAPLCLDPEDPEAPPSWQAISREDPAYDPAPWFSTAYDESADVLGFWVEEWTGLDSGHSSRTSTRVGRPGGGTQLGPLGSNERVMKLNVLVLGLSDRALEYAFHWLSNRLGNVCASCATSSVLLRRFCPDTPSENLWTGVSELRKVGLLEDLKWESAPVENAGCFIRRLSFTLSASDPCLYSPSSAPTVTTSNGTMATCLSALDLEPGKAFCRPMCFDLPPSCRTSFTFSVPETIGGIAPILSINNEHDAPVPPLRVICYSDPHDDGVAPNPCGLDILGEIYTRVIPPWTEIVWDVTARTILYANATAADFAGGMRYMDAVDPPHDRFFVLPCGTAHIVVEPASSCLEVDAANSRYTYAGYQFDWADLHFPSFTLQLQERLGCA